MPSGKLRWAGRAWAEGTLNEDDGPDELAQDAEFFGLDIAGLTPDPAGVWPDHIPAVLAFLAVQTQWRWVSVGPGMLLATGLDYSAATAALTHEGLEITSALWGDLRVIEAGAREALNEVHP